MLESKIYVARDPFGIKPLYVLESNEIVFSSEMKVLQPFYEKMKCPINHFQPGTYSIYTLPFKVCPIWKLKKSIIFYTMVNAYNKEKINTRYLVKAIKKRVHKKFAILLSDNFIGLNELKEFSNEPLETYSIGVEGSEHLKIAKEISKKMGTNHKEIIIEECIDVPKITDMDNMNIYINIHKQSEYILGKYISENSDAKCIIIGKNFDIEDPILLDKKMRNWIKNIHREEIKSKCFEIHGIETIYPFLDKQWINYYFSIYPEWRNVDKYMEKY
jgi:asparagine synthase (glutamine-hydrolysing)